MNLTDIIGSLGVFLILLAYVLSVRFQLSNKSLSYMLLNFIGASLACIASVMLMYIPFIILEAAWALVSLHSLGHFLRSTTTKLS